MKSPEVSSHPEATISDSQYSLADIQRRQSQPIRWMVFIGAVLIAIIVPYWWGRALAMHHTVQVMRMVSSLDPRGIALIAWTVTLVAFVGIGLSIIESSSWFWRVVFTIGLAAEQFIAGLCLLKVNFWYSTYVVYQKSAVLANAANLGILAAGMGVAVFALVFVAILVGVKKDSPWNILTHSWSALSMFFVIELAAIVIVMFGGLIH
ncbi:hypothetical protein [Bombiscardovia coagulans]|uniref:Teichoic acid transporter n=1 Tax=Bombiscardovia coagulans TaxID=686666 RepID=A0A261EQ05_9BIFI|nr:hypothetical protein [Bombiscardovia coagulans]OZG48935.1 teichoic acid transporter [Bombiscardovia coagulans]